MDFFCLSSNVNEVIRAVLNSIFFLRKDFAHTKSTKSTKRYKRTLEYGGPTAPIIALPYIRTKTSFLGLFKKLFWINKSKIVLMTSFTLLLNDLLKLNRMYG